MLKNFALLLFCALCTTSMTLAAAESFRYAAPDAEMNSILASVNGEAISLQDVLQLTRAREYQAYAAFSGKRLEKEIKSIRRQAVDELINRKLVIAEYYKQKFRISESDIEHEIDQSTIQLGCRSRSEFRKKLESENIDFQHFRKNIEERMIYFYMIQRLNAIEGNPTPKEIFEYFDANKKSLSAAETYELAMLKVDNSSPHITEISEALKTDAKNFFDLVKRHNPNNNGGRLGAIEPAKLRLEFAAALKTPVVGKIYGPIKLDDGVAWIKLLKHNKAADASFQSVQEQIKQKLLAERRKKSIDLYTGTLRRDALLEYFF